MKHARLLPFLFACCILPAQANTPAGEKPLVVVNGEAIPAIYGNFIRQNRVKRNMPPEALTDNSIKEGAITAALLAQEAVRKGLDKDPVVAAALEFQQMELLGRATLEDYLRANPIKEETVRTEYENAKAKAGESEYRARHILVNSEKEARDLIDKLTARKKAKFEDLAKKHSKDTSAGNGGDLGWVLPGTLVSEFGQAMVDLKQGEITREPVRTRFGWHVIRLDDTRKLDFPDYEKIRDRIAEQLQKQAIGNLVRELLATAKVE